MKFSPPFFVSIDYVLKKELKFTLSVKQNIMKNKFAYQVSLNNFKTIKNVKF